MKKVECDLCGAEVAEAQLTNHRGSKCCQKGNKASVIFTPVTTSLICPFCAREAKTLNSAAQHLVRCKENPNGIKVLPSFGMKGKKGRNQFTKAKDLGLPKPEVSEETRKRLSVCGGNQVWSEERRTKHSEVMLKIAKENSDSYGAGNQGRAKTVEIDGIKLKGSWEVKFYQWCKSQSIRVERPVTGFPYEWKGIRTYYPDFYLPELFLYVEVKGYETDRDLAKWNSFTEVLSVVKEKEIKLIDKGEFSLEKLRERIRV